MARTARRPPGRPASSSGAGVREELLEAATRLVVERGRGAGVSVREIATEAGTTPAMIAYYFGDKRGLYEALLDRVFQRLIERVRELATAPPPDASALEAFIHVYVRTLAAEPWVPGFLLREVLGGEAEFRERFIERFARPMAALLPALVASEVEAGKLRRDLDPVLLVLSLAGMCAFPFVAQPIFEPVFGLGYDDAFFDRLVEHTTRLFLDGARPETRS